MSTMFLLFEYSSTFESVINTDDLNLIQYDSLKYLFQEYSALLNYAYRLSRDTENFFNNYVRSYNINQIGGNHIIKLNIEEYSNRRNIVDIQPFDGLNKSNFTIDPQEILSDKRFESTISISLSLFYWYKLSLRQIESHIGIMKDYIETRYDIE